MGEVKLPVTCPLCGRKSEYSVDDLAEGAVWKCSFCPVSLTLHGHMWKDISAEIEKLKKNATEATE
jgi:ribosomal protein L37AE/L43A